MNKTWIVWLAAGGCALAALCPACSRLTEGKKDSGRKGATPAVAVEVSEVRTATVRDVGTFAGSLEPRAQFVVAPKIAGRLEKLTVDIGDRVKRGQVIALLDRAELAQEAEEARAALNVATASVDNCRSDLEVAKREYDRTVALLAKKIASESEMDAAEAQYKACQARLKVAEALVEQRAAALSAANIRLSYTEIRALWDPAAGGGADEPVRVVGERFVREGYLLKANEPIVSVLDERTLIAAINVIDRDYPKICVAQAASIFSEAFPGEAFAGKVSRLAPLLKESSRQARVEIEVPNTPARLKTGMFVTASIEFARHEGVATVPRSALVRRGGAQGIFLADLDALKARFVPVTVGVADGEMVEIVKPEKLAGLVVTLGQHLLEDGAAIVVPDRGAVGGGAASAPPGAGRPRGARQ